MKAPHLPLPTKLCLSEIEALEGINSFQGFFLSPKLDVSSRAGPRQSLFPANFPPSPLTHLLREPSEMKYKDLSSTPAFNFAPQIVEGI